MELHQLRHQLHNYAPTPTPDPTPGVPNIINQNLNQGGGGDGGPQGIAQPKQYFEKTYTGATFPDGTPIMSGFEETEGPGFFDSIANALSGLAGLYQQYSPVGMIGEKYNIEKNFNKHKQIKHWSKLLCKKKLDKLKQLNKLD